MRFTLFSSAGGSAVPYCLGFAFRRGDIPSGSTVESTVGNLQVTVRNTWTDGSLKFAQLAGTVDMSAGGSQVVTLRKAAPRASGTALTPADLRRTAVAAQVGCGAFGTASWSAADWESPFMSWVSGPTMSSWIYRKPVGADAHLVAWLEVRLYVGGQVEVLPWVENGYVAVAGPSNKSTTYTFSLGGTQRFSAAIDLKHHQRTPLVSGAALSYWQGVDPGVTAQHDAWYLMSTELVPTYFAAPGAATVHIDALPATYAPLQAGSFNYYQDSMAAPGYQEPIGLLPQHDVLYLVGDRSSVYASVVRNGYSSGRWGIHYRDEATNRPLRFSQHPTRVISDAHGFKDNGGSTTSTRTPIATGGNPPQWDVAHSPSVGYLAYLVTGRFYFMEEVQFAATANYLGNGDPPILRDGAKGLVQTAIDAWQTRSCAWDWRSKIQALTVTPDDDAALRGELISCAESNIDFFHGRYVAQPNNPFGLILPGETYNGTWSEVAIWQQDFVTAVFGWAVSLDLPIASAAKAKLDAFFRWKAKSIVMRLGKRPDWWYLNAAPYTIKVSSVVGPNYATGAGPWFPDAGAAYAASYTPQPTWFSTTEGVLAAEFDIGSWALSMWGNLQPAIAYAVRHGVPGALEGYARMVGAKNWPELRTAFDARPVWSVAPMVRPAWMSNQPLNEWFEIPGTSGAAGAPIEPWAGFTLREETGEVFILCSGGHGDSNDNRVVSLPLFSDAPAWQLRSASSPVAIANASYYSDGKPGSRHIYHHNIWVPQVGRLMMFGLRSTWPDSGAFPTVDGFDPDTNTWDPAGRWPDLPPGYFGAVKDPRNGNVWLTTPRKWRAADGLCDPAISARVPTRWPQVWDSSRSQIFTLCWGDGQGFDTGVNASRINPDTGVQTAITFSPSSALTQFIADQPQYAGMDYDPLNDRFLFFAGVAINGAARVADVMTRIYVITPNSGTTWDMSLLTLGSGTVTPAPVPASGINSRFKYVPALKGFVMLPNGTSNVYFMRTA